MDINKISERLNYQYVFYDSKDDYYVVALSDVNIILDSQIYRYELEGKCKIFRYIYQALRRFVKKQGLLRKFLRLFFPMLFTQRTTTNKPLCFVFSSKYNYLLKAGYSDYLRKKYKNCKIVVVFRDTIVHQKKVEPDFSVEELRKNCDVIITANRKDAKQYSFVQFDSFCSNIPVKKADDYPLSDVVFIGVAKDRLPVLHAAYKKFTKAGLKCDFYITGVAPEEMIKDSKIQYARHPVTYSEMLYRTRNSRCIFEVTQGGSDGFTSRFFEALCYDKLLITDNSRVKETKFYNSDFILYYENVDDIDEQFVLKNTDVKYRYNDEYSPIRMLELIEEVLSKNED